MKTNKQIIVQNTIAINKFFQNAGLVDKSMPDFLFDMLALLARSTEENFSEQYIQDSVLQIEIIKELVTDLKPTST